MVQVARRDRSRQDDQRNDPDDMRWHEVSGRQEKTGDAGEDRGGEEGRGPCIQHFRVDQPDQHGKA